MLAVIVLFAMQLTDAAAPSDFGDIIVTATPRGCRVRLAERTLSMGDLRDVIAGWDKGVPVRVVAPAGADYKCLAKIALRLADRGFEHVVFVDSLSK